MATVFNRVGRYEIHEQIGRGGMAVVFLATDTQTNQRVALKLVSIEADRDSQQVLEAERWGATLQEEFSRESRYVPAVYDYGTHGPYFFIAMEYLSGRNLSELIGAGPMPAERAVHIAAQLCEFLEAADAFERTLNGRKFNRLLHGDLKPRNIRVLDGDEIKVFDFGIAKALSLSRKVTRNDFGSIAYLSPERLESGEIDTQAELWAVGVLLYEMVSGVQPFRAADTRRLEQRIRARQPPTSLDGTSPPALQAIIAKLLAPESTDRYGSATAIRDDLRRFTAGDGVEAQREGWPDRRHDEPATRRTHNPSMAQGSGDEEVTRRTVRDSSSAPVTTPSGDNVSVAATSSNRPRGARLRRLVRRVLTALAIVIVLNEIRVYSVAGALAQSVPQEIGGVIQMWNQREALTGSSLGLGVRRLERALIRQAAGLAEGTFTRYRTAGATVYEKEWRLTRDALVLATNARPSDQTLLGALRYCDGHLRRIDGEARLKAKQEAAAKDELTAAVTAYRAAAELRPGWPDPFLGLMRAFINLEDIERGADALAQAERDGYTAGNRDWVLLGEGYMARARKLADSEELEPLTRAADAYSRAIEYFSKAATFGTVPRRLREAEARLKEVQARIETLSEPINSERVILDRTA